MLSEADIRAALRDCYDPTLPCNIVDLGLVRAITVTLDPDAPGIGIPGVPRKHCVHLTLALASPSDDANAQLSAQVVNRLAGLEEVGHTDVTLETTPPWSPLDITAAGRRTLGLEGNPALVQIR